MSTKVTPPQPPHPFLAMVPEGSPPKVRLLILQGMGVPDLDLIAVAQYLIEDPGEALLSVPLPLERILAVLPAREAETAILGFTVSDLLSSGHIDCLPSAWRHLPSTLHALYQSEDPRIHQVVYLGTLLYRPRSKDAWEHAWRVMQRLAHKRALSPHSIPAFPFLSDLYDNSPSTAHPYQFFSTHSLANHPMEVA